MASFFGQPCITIQGGNTGKEKCTDDTNLVVVGDLLIPDGMTFLANDLTTIVSTLQTAAKNPDKSKRIFPIYGYQEVEDQTEERQTAQKGYGASFHTRDEILAFRYMLVGDSCLNMSMAGFRNAHQAYNRIMVFADGSLGATERTLANGSKAYGGFTLSQLYPGPFMPNNGSDPAQWTIYYQHAYLTEWDKRVIIKPEGANVLTDLKGLKTISFDYYPADPVVPGEYEVALTSGCGRVNISKIYGTELATVAIWNITNATTGNAITVSSATLLPNGRTKLELDDADPDFTAATKLKIELDDITALDTAGIKGYESGYTIISKS